MSENSEHSEMAGGISEEKEAPVNPSILTMMKEMQNNIASLASFCRRKIRNQDIKLQRTQTLVAKAIVPQLQQINLLLNCKAKRRGPVNEGPHNPRQWTVSKLMTYVYCDLSQRRREFHYPTRK
uniref:Uncharacterized protein n=1 Tax=Magallana gigas TaxID=29159 RepID=A0A8W8L3Y6_MAGGI